MSNTLPTTYQQFIATSRYSRWVDELGRRETWEESVSRYFTFFLEKLQKEGKLTDRVVEELHECRDAVASLEVMPSMRALMTAGKALERDHVAGFNCLSKETRILTKEYGIIPISDAVGPCTVLSSDGQWHQAEVNSFGVQNLFKIDLKLNSNTVKSVYATENHRWLLSDGRWMTTAQLRKYDKIPFCTAPRVVDTGSIDYRRGVQHGLVYGDGARTLSSCKRTKGYHIRVCSDHEDIAPWFNEYPSCEFEGDPIFMMYDGFAKTHKLKELPCTSETSDYIIGFFRGWFAADGYCGKVNSQISICVGPEEEEWLRKVMPVYGYSFQGSCILPSETNYGKRNKESRSLKISRSSMTSEDFLIGRKLDAFKPLESHYVVSSVEKTDRMEDVYCATVPDTSNFVLEGGLVTGNCSYVAVDHPHAFDEILYVLCCGTGVGFSVEQEDVMKLPEVPYDLHPTDSVIVVADSKIGWASAFRELISMLYAGKVPKWDVSKIRPAGARLKTFGGRASGPDPLVKLFEFTVDVFRGAAGRKLKAVECHDIVCKVAEIVVVGGVRRSALISLSDLSDVEMRHSKAGNWWENNVQRALANNSAVYDKKPDVGQFMEEWISLYRSGSGERGIFNRYAAKRYISELPERESDYRFGTNPCCVKGDCEILTDVGYLKIEDLVDTEVNVWNGEEFSSVTPFYAGEGDIVRVTLSDGTSLECTPNHKFVLEGMEFVEASDLIAGDRMHKFSMPVVNGEENYPGDAYSQGFYSGDGNSGYSFSWVYKPKYSCLSRLVGTTGEPSKYNRVHWQHGSMLDKGFVPVNGSVEYKLNWLAGLLDADGTVTRDKNGNGLQIASVDHDFLSRVRLMLTTLGVRAKVVHAASAGQKSMPDGRGGYANYSCKETKRLLIGNSDTCHLVGLGLKFNRLEVHGNPPQRDARQFVRVVSVESTGERVPVYCFTEPKMHTGTFNGIVTGQSEILLRSAQFCNLTSVQIAADDTLRELKRKVRIATILGTLQSSLTDFRYLRKVWKRNSEEERLLGVSLSGICDNPLTNNPHSKDLPKLLTALREHAREVNKEWAGLIGINPSAAITCVKPEGTTSQLCDRASGIHPRYSPYYIRTVRSDKKDPLAKLMKDSGFPVEDDVTKPDSTYVFSFPMKSPKGALMRDDLTAIDQLELWMVYKKYWADHTVSCTIYVRENEWIDVAGWVYKNFDNISGVSFLPHSNHVYKQAPYQEISEAEYKEFLKKMPESINWEALSDYEREDQTTGTQELACSGGSCELV